MDMKTPVATILSAFGLVAGGAVPPYANDGFVPEVMEKATGFFRVVERGDGRWWAIDPLGRGTVLRGVDHVRYDGFWSERVKPRRSVHREANLRRFPNKADWEKDALKRLSCWGFNMLGAGCDRQLQHRGLVHTKFLSMGNMMCDPNGPRDRFICPNESRPCSSFPNVFWAGFEKWCDDMARKMCAPERDDPWLFGYFIDNELAWWGRGKLDTGLFDYTEGLPDGHSAKTALRKFVSEHGGKTTTEVKRAFLRLVADRYFRITTEAIRRHDPNHLVLGSRFAGIDGAHADVWEIAGRYCDVVTFNCYPTADLDRNRVMLGGERIPDVFSRRYALVRRPMLVTEWSFPALDSGLPCKHGAGQRFRTQKERTMATELFAKTMLALPFMIGYDYFMWVDEPAEGMTDAFPEDTNYGLVKLNGDAWPEITEMFAHLHREIGRWRKVPFPAERPALPDKNTMTAAQAVERMVGKTSQGVAFARDGDSYCIRNVAGLKLSGRIGGRYMFDSISLDGKELGEFCCMLHDVRSGVHRWSDTDKVTDAAWNMVDGAGALTLRAERREGAHAFSMVVNVFAATNKPGFLVELTNVENIGSAMLDVRSLYFRLYSPFAHEKRGVERYLKVPNLWRAPKADAWRRLSDGAYLGGYTSAASACTLDFHTDKNGDQHPDAEFAPAGIRPLVSGECFDPNGAVWMLVRCGFEKK